jgi:hypothetical protein
VSYALIRGQQYISTETGREYDALIPTPLLLCDDAATAWLSATIDEALERAALLRMCWGWTTEIRAIR